VTATEWQTIDDPAKMLEFLWPRNRHGSHDTSVTQRRSVYFNRKLRLFACACCLLNGRVVSDIEYYEQHGFVDRGRTNRNRDIGDDTLYSDVIWAKAWASQNGTGVPSQAIKAILIREIFGDPFSPRYEFSDICRPGHDGDLFFLPKHWLNADVIINIAQAAYDNRDWVNLPILADMLEERGCWEQPLLDHLRLPDCHHVRGCWVVDLILGK
jgi:hypothetical protein